MISDIHSTVDHVRKSVQDAGMPSVSRVARRERDPFHVLVSCLLSLRTQDKTTYKASRDLLQRAGTPTEMLALTEDEIRTIIYPVGFYRRKAFVVRRVSQELLDRFRGGVPQNLEDLLSLTGVGRKTANLVLTLGYGLPGICVDTHVHRIMNRWGYVSTKNPDATEMLLRRRLPAQYWLEINELLVKFGQTICKPLSPWCSRCPLLSDCPRTGVSKFR